MLTVDTIYIVQRSAECHLVTMKMYGGTINGKLNLNIALQEKPLHPITADFKVKWYLHNLP